LIDQHRNKKFWRRNENWDWEFKCDSFLSHELNKLNRLKLIEEFSDFVITTSYYSTDKKDNYILIGKGFA
jgi:hypothetical protein